MVQADLFASTAQPVRKNKPDAFNAGSQAAAAAPVPKSAQSQMWDKLQVNKMVCFVMKGDNPANLRTAEVISLADDKRSGEFWFWIDGSGTYRSDKPFGQRRLTPEWADHRGRTRIKPKPDQQREWAPRQHNYSIQDIDIILTSLAIHSGGKPAQPDVERVNRWLEITSKTDTRARAAITKNVMLLHQVLMMENDRAARRESDAFKAGTDEASVGACSHKHAVPINQCKTGKKPPSPRSAIYEKEGTTFRWPFAGWLRRCCRWRSA